MELGTVVEIIVLVLTIPCAIAAIASVWVLLAPNQAMPAYSMLLLLSADSNVHILNLPSRSFQLSSIRDSLAGTQSTRH